MQKGPQRRRFHRIGKEETPECHCQEEQSGIVLYLLPVLKSSQGGTSHVVETYSKLAETRGGVEDEMEEWQTRHLRNRKREKGNVRVEKEREKQEGDRMESFFLYGV